MQRTRRNNRLLEEQKVVHREKLQEFYDVEIYYRSYNNISKNPTYLFLFKIHFHIFCF
jgi:hypothetical protein